MRELKFRTWDTQKEKYIMTGFHVIGECTAFDLLNQYSLKHYCDLVVEQSTGKQDKNGKDIYEGDLIKGLFDYGPAGFVEQTLPVHWNDERGYQWEQWDLKSIEVVGNVNEMEKWKQNQPT